MYVILDLKQRPFFSSLSKHF